MPSYAQWSLIAAGARRSRNEMNCAATGGADRWRAACPVGSFRQTPEGLCDQYGNVREWCRLTSDEACCAVVGGSWWDAHNRVFELKSTGCGQRRNYIGFRVIALPDDSE